MHPRRTIANPKATAAAIAGSHSAPYVIPKMIAEMTIIGRRSAWNGTDSKSALLIRRILSIAACSWGADAASVSPVLRRLKRTSARFRILTIYKARTAMNSWAVWMASTMS
jgi:hypothetical protein